MKIVKSQSFKVKPSFFFEEKTSLPILKVLYNNPKLNSDPNLLEEKKELLNQTNPPEFKEMIENDKILLSEPIFNELCSQSKYSKGNKCVVCDGKFGILKQRKNCGFCGEAVCGEHREKKRPNPKNEKEIVKICEICERKYLEKMIYQVFLMKKNMKNKEIFGIEQELSKTKEESKIKKKEIFSLLTEVFLLIKVKIKIIDFWFRKRKVKDCFVKK